jgi:CopG family transcriptional regulator, nickel-responsive regulator
MGLDAISQLARLSVSLPAELLAQLDAMVKKRKLPSRSQMIAELIRHELAEQSEEFGNDILAGTVTIVYQASNGHVRHALMKTQKAYLKEVIASQHVFLEEGRSMEVMLVQGPGERLTKLCDALRRVKAVKQLKLVTTTALLPPLHHYEKGRARPTKRSNV